MRYFIWIFTVCQSSRLGGSGLKRVNGPSFEISKSFSEFPILLFCFNLSDRITQPGVMPRYLSGSTATHFTKIKTFLHDFGVEMVNLLKLFLGSLYFHTLYSYL